MFYSLLTLLFSGLTILVLFPCLVLLGECLAAILPLKPRIEGTRPERIAVLIPAHNEAQVIERTLDSIAPQLQPTDTLIVVADNCTDATADLARSKGAKVLERFDTQARGKGHALAYGVRSLFSINPDIVVFMDADCDLSPGSLEQLAIQALATGKPVQGKYLMEYPSEPGIKDLISGFAFLVKNWVRPLGLANLGNPCLLTGTGMAFPWSILQNAPLASDNLVEDMQLGIDLAIAGHASQFCADAEITGRFPQQIDNATTQRTRWEHGHLKTLSTQVPRLLQASWQQRRFDLLVLAAEVGIPPLSFLVLLWGGMTFLAVIAIILQIVGILPLVLLLIAGLALLVSVLTAWAGFARSRLPLSSLLMIPLYLLWKIPIYLAFIWRPQTEWIRTDREKES